MNPLFEKRPVFRYLKENPEEFARVSVDVCKFGKQWAVSVEAMNREYGAAVRWQ